MSRRPTQLKFKLKHRFAHGGARKGAGRPRRSSQRSHLPRSRFTSREPLHVTVRLRDGLPSLRRKDLYRCLKQAVARARLKGLAIAQFSILSNHVHLILEAESPGALQRQMQSLGISLARRLNRVIGRKGVVFHDRYHLHVLKTPTETARALAYVLTNEFRRRKSRGRVDLDQYSSAILLNESDWSRILGRRWRRVVGFPDEHGPAEVGEVEAIVREFITPSRSWLLRTGWRRAGR